MKWKFYFLVLSAFLYLPFSAAAIDLSASEILHYEYSKDGTEVNVWTKGTAIQKDRTILSPSREQISANTYSIYPGAKFYQEAGTWYEVERYTQDAETFIAPSASLFGIKKALADYLPTFGIGYTYGSDATYANARSTGTDSAPNWSYYLANTWNGANYVVIREAMFFDVTGLSISSSTLRFLYSNASASNVDSDSVSIVLFSPTTWGSIGNGDHNLYGSTKLANDIAFSSLSNGVWYSMPITDISGFTNKFSLGFRTAKDISNTTPTGANRATFTDAYLLIETTASPTPTPGTSTATTTAADYERLSAFALTGAVSLLFFLVGFGLVVFIYKML